MKDATWNVLFITGLLAHILPRIIKSVLGGVFEYTPAQINLIFVILFISFGAILSIKFSDINKLKTRKKIIILYISTVLFLILNYKIEPVKWDDAELYFKTAENIANDFPNINFKNIDRLSVLIFAIPMLIFGVKKEIMMITEITIAAIIPIAMYGLMKLFFNKRDALAIAIFMITIPAFITNSKQSLLDSFMFLFNILTIYYYLKGINDNDNRSIILSGAAYVLSLVTKPSALILIPLMIVITLHKKSKKVILFAITMISILSILSLIGYNYFDVIKMNADLRVTNYTTAKTQLSMRTLIISPLHEHFQFGLPTIFLIILWIINLKNKPKYEIMIVLLFYAFIMMIYGSEIARQTYSLLPFLYIAIGKEMKRLSNRFIKMGIITNIMLSLLYTI